MRKGLNSNKSKFFGCRLFIAASREYALREEGNVVQVKIYAPFYSVGGMLFPAPLVQHMCDRNKKLETC